MTQTKTKPSVGGPPSQWPPLAHKIRPGQKLEPGTIALCGAKLMGIKLDSASKVCAKCEEIMWKEIRGGS